MSEKIELKKTLGLTGITMNAMALIAPGAFLWLTFQLQASQVNGSGESTAMDIFAGLAFALILSFLTAISYSKLSELYPDAGTGSSYYFAEHAFLNETSKISSFSRIIKFIVGWISHLYYWAYPGVMIAMLATLITYIFSQFGIIVPIGGQILIAIVFAGLTGAVAYRGINGSTISSIVINVIQIVTLVFVTILALIYRSTNPEHVQFVHKNLLSVVMPHSISNVLFQSTIAMLVLVGFESATAFAAEAKSPKSVSRGVILSLVIQGLFCYFFAYIGTNLWINDGYKVVSNGKTLVGMQAAAASSAPIGDMVKILGDTLLHNSGFILMILVALSVALAVFGSTLACMNTGVRMTYAMAKDREMPSVLGLLHPRHATPHTAVWVITVVSAIIGGIGVISITNLTAVTLLSNIGTFILYGMTNLNALLAFLHAPKKNFITHIIVPILGFLANVVLLLAIFYLGILGGGATQVASISAIVATIIWIIIGIAYYNINGKKIERLATISK